MKTIAEFISRLLPGVQVVVVHHRAKKLGRDKWDNPIWEDSEPQLRRVVKAAPHQKGGNVHFETLGGAPTGLGLVMTIPSKKEIQFTGEHTATILAKTKVNGPKGQRYEMLPVVTYSIVD